MVIHEGVVELANHYRRLEDRASFADLKELAGRYLQRRATSILDATAIGFAFDALFSEAVFDAAKVTPEMAEAWQLAYPNVPIESLAGRSLEEVAGAVSGWKGKLFEVEVANRLNDGEWVGDLHLEPGQVARLADSPTQPGWDLQIFDDDGTTVDLVQLKATESVSYIHEALDRYPDTPILATSEVASHLTESGVMASDISNDALTDALHDQIADATADTVSDGIMGTLPVSVIVATEAYNVISGKKNIDQALDSGGVRLAKGAVAGAVAAGVSVIATPLVGAIAGFIARMWIEDATTTPQQRRELVIPDYEGMLRTIRQATASSYFIGTNYGVHSRPPLALPVDASDDKRELAECVEPELRLEILRDGMALKDWIKFMAKLDASELSQDELDFHRQVLREISSAGLLDIAFSSEDYTLGRFGRAFDSDYRDAKKQLESAVEICDRLSKKFTGSFTSEDAERIRYLKLSKTERLERIFNDIERKRQERDSRFKRKGFN